MRRFGPGPRETPPPALTARRGRSLTGAPRRGRGGADPGSPRQAAPLGRAALAGGAGGSTAAPGPPRERLRHAAPPADKPSAGEIPHARLSDRAWAPKAQGTGGLPTCRVS